MFPGRLVYKTEGQRLNPLSYAFMFVTFSYGIGFVFFGSAEGVVISGIWMSFSIVNHNLPFIWGCFALAAPICWLLALLTRREPFGTISSMLGFMVWVFASLVLIHNGFWVILATAAIPNLYYWGWLYTAFMDYKRRRAKNLFIEP